MNRSELKGKKKMCKSSPWLVTWNPARVENAEQTQLCTKHLSPILIHVGVLRTLLMFESHLKNAYSMKVNFSRRESLNKQANPRPLCSGVLSCPHALYVSAPSCRRQHAKAVRKAEATRLWFGAWWAMKGRLWLLLRESAESQAVVGIRELRHSTYFMLLQTISSSDH